MRCARCSQYATSAHLIQQERNRCRQLFLRYTPCRERLPGPRYRDPDALLHAMAFCGASSLSHRASRFVTTASNISNGRRPHG